MKRLVLGSLMSCMLVGQAFASEGEEKKSFAREVGERLTNRLVEGFLTPQGMAVSYSGAILGTAGYMGYFGGLLTGRLSHPGGRSVGLFAGAGLVGLAGMRGCSKRLGEKRWDRYGDNDLLDIAGNAGGLATATGISAYSIFRLTRLVMRK